MSITITLTEDIAACLALRRIVFIQEQGVSEADEIDDLDRESLNLIAKNGLVFDDAGVDHRGMVMTL